MATVKSVVVVMVAFMHRAASINTARKIPTVPEMRVVVTINARTGRVVSVNTLTTMMEIVPAARVAVAMNVETALIARDFPVTVNQTATSGNSVVTGLAPPQIVLQLRLLPVLRSQTIKPVSSLAPLLVQSSSVVWFPSVCTSAFAVERNRYAKEPYQNRD